ncbi:type II secretion system protein GspG [Planctomycetota bacterium]|nr:type II secretion system protein GspG [Planctomycetota bacterium]
MVRRILPALALTLAFAAPGLAQSNLKGVWTGTGTHTMHGDMDATLVVTATRHGRYALSATYATSRGDVITWSGRGSQYGSYLVARVSYERLIPGLVGAIDARSGTVTVQGIAILNHSRGVLSGNWRSSDGVDEVATTLTLPASQRDPVDVTDDTFDALDDAITRYVTDTGFLPNTLANLETAPATNSAGWAGPYSAARNDGWGNAVAYMRTTNDDYALVSYGADGAPGGVVGSPAADLSHQRSMPPMHRGELASDFADTEDAVSRFTADVGRLPQYLSELFSPAASVANWNGPYVQSWPRDPWGNRYLYTPVGPRSFELLSLGADAAPGGALDGTDVVHNVTLP